MKKIQRENKIRARESERYTGDRECRSLEREL